MKLTTQQQIAMSGLIKVLVFLGAIALVALILGCVPKPEPITVYHESSRAAALIAAGLHASQYGGKVYELANTGSMEPTLHGGDYVVGVQTPYESLEVGMIVNYRPDFANGILVIHRIVARWSIGDGFVMEGDSSKNRAETNERMTQDKYVDHIVAVYRFP